MNFISHNQGTFDTCGTSFLGEINIDYEKIQKLFGEPTKGDGDKTDAEWEIKFEDGQVATIYNYKNGKVYKGKKGLTVTEIIDWHIGGKNNIVLDRIRELLGIL
jgi:hypothetical protein